MHIVDARPGTMEVGFVGKSALVAGACFVCLGLFGVSVDLPRIHAAFAGTGAAALAPWVGSIVSPAFALASLLAGAVVTRFGYRRVYLVSIVLFSLFGAAPAVIDNIYLILLLRIALGCAVAGAITATMDGIGRLPEDQRPNLLGLQTVFGTLTAAVLFPVAGLLAREGWHLPFLVHLAGLVVVPMALALPSAKAGTPPAHAAAQRGALLAGVAPYLFLFAIAVSLSMFVLQILGPFYLIHIGITDSATAAIPLTAMAFVGMACATAFGWLHRRLGTRKVFLITTAGASLALVGASFAPNLGIFTAAAVLLGICMPLMVSNLYTATLECPVSEPGRALGAVNCALYLSPLLLPPSAAVLNARLGEGGTFLAYGLAMLAWCLWFLLGKAGAPFRRKARPGTLPLEPRWGQAPDLNGKP